jgi:hypothetical protein
VAAAALIGTPLAMPPVRAGLAGLAELGQSRTGEFGMLTAADHLGEPGLWQEHGDEYAGCRFDDGRLVVYRNEAVEFRCTGPEMEFTEPVLSIAVRLGPDEEVCAAVWIRARFGGGDRIRLCPDRISLLTQAPDRTDDDDRTAFIGTDPRVFRHLRITVSGRYVSVAVDGVTYLHEDLGDVRPGRIDVGVLRNDRIEPPSPGRHQIAFKDVRIWEPWR